MQLRNSEFALRFKQAGKNVLILLISIAVIGITPLLIVWLYTFEWTGFFAKEFSSGEASYKTLWDWSELLIIPSVLALVAYLFRKSETKLSREQALDDQNERVVSEYISHVQDFLLRKNPQENDIRVLKARTQLLFTRLNPERKLRVLRFLHEANFIVGHSPLLHLNQVDLSFIDFSLENLTNISLEGGILNSAKLRGTSLPNAFLGHSSLHKTDLSFATLDGCDFTGTMSEKADFYASSLKDVSFIEANASKANFANAKIEGGIFRSAKLIGANFRNATLTGANLIDADLSGANLSGANLTGANLRNANLLYAKLDNANLAGADLSFAVVSAQQLGVAKLSNTIQSNLRARPLLTRISGNAIRFELAKGKLLDNDAFSEQDEPGVFDLIEDSEENLTRATASMGRISERTKQLGQLVRQKTEQLQDATNNSSKKNLIDTTGRSLEGYATQINSEAEVTSSNLQAAFLGYGRVVALLSGTQGGASLIESGTTESINSLLTSMNETLNNIYEMQGVIADMPGMSTQLIKGKNRAHAAITKLIDDLNKAKFTGFSVQSWISMLTENQPPQAEAQ